MVVIDGQIGKVVKRSRIFTSLISLFISKSWTNLPSNEIFEFKKCLQLKLRNFFWIGLWYSFKLISLEITDLLWLLRNLDSYILNVTQIVEITWFLRIKISLQSSNWKNKKFARVSILMDNIFGIIYNQIECMDQKLYCFGKIIIFSVKWTKLNNFHYEREICGI